MVDYRCDCIDTHRSIPKIMQMTFPFRSDDNRNQCARNKIEKCGL